MTQTTNQETPETTQQPGSVSDKEPCDSCSHCAKESEHEEMEKPSADATKPAASSSSEQTPHPTPSKLPKPPMRHLAIVASISVILDLVTKQWAIRVLETPRPQGGPGILTPILITD